MGMISQILIITDRQRVLGEDTDMVTVLSLYSQLGGAKTIINALEACRQHGLNHLDRYPHFVSVITRAFTRDDDENKGMVSGVMPYSIDTEKGMSFLSSHGDLYKVMYSEQAYLPVIDLTGYEYDCGEEPMLYLMPRSSNYYRYYLDESNIYPLNDEGLTKAIERLM